MNYKRNTNRFLLASTDKMSEVLFRRGKRIVALQSQGTEIDWLLVENVRRLLRRDAQNVVGPFLKRRPEEAFRLVPIVDGFEVRPGMAERQFRRFDVDAQSR